MSMHAAGLAEAKETYIWQALSTPDFKTGAAPGFTQITGALREYSIAGVLHLDHLAVLTDQRHVGAIDHHVFKIARALSQAEDDVRKNLMRVLNQHKEEWQDFMDWAGSRSFLAGWASGTR